MTPFKQWVSALAAASVVLLHSPSMGAQSLRLRIVEEDTHAPLAGALVSALGRSGVAGPPALVSVNGLATVQVTGRGPYRFVVRRIGYQPVTTDSIAAPIRADSIVNIVFPVRRILLSPVTIVEDAPCTDRTASPSSAAAPAWTDARTALEASALTRAQRLVTTSVIRFRRELTPNGRVSFADTARVRSGERPFVAVSPAALERDGYFRWHDDGSQNFYAPDEDVLLSEGFVRRHCITRSPLVRHDARGSEVALRFAPRANASLSDIKGFIWIDSLTSELREVDFEYVNMSLPAAVDSLGGSVTFQHLASGAWIVSAWTLRMPRFRMVDRRRNYVVLDQYVEVGGTAAVEADFAMAAAAERRTIDGTVYDSLAYRGLSGARVHLLEDMRDAVADSTGAFHFDSVRAGVHTIWVDHPRLDSLRVFSFSARVDVTPQMVTSVAFATPSIASLSRRMCAADTALLQTDRGFVFGHIRVAGSNEPIVRESIAVSWQVPGAAENRSGLTKRVVAPDSLGNYALCGIPLHQAISIQASAGTYASIPVTFKIGAVRFARRDITIPSNESVDAADFDATSQAPGRALDGATITGFLSDSAGDAIPSVLVTVSGVAFEWRTDHDGRFVLQGVPAGARVLTAKALGYLPERRFLDLLALDSATLDLSLTRLVTKLSTVTIRERQSAFRLALDQRRRAGFGYWTDSTELGKRPAYDLSEAFSGPGVKFAPSNKPGCLAPWMIKMHGLNSFPGGGSGADKGTARDSYCASLAMDECLPSIWIDDMLADQEMLVLLHKEEVAVIEMYTSAASAPLQYSGSRTNCGVVLVWRKRFVSP
jgi:hypothetical protein